MTDVSDRISRRQVDKFAERRAQLATSALRTLSELGYARTSLREIAQNSDFSHGVLHYYFRDKVELIMFCVKLYKAECVTRYDQIVATAQSADQLRADFAQALAATCDEDGTMHRLWYDLRNQALFEESFREDVLEIDKTLELMIWRIVSTYADLSGKPITVSPATAYAQFDGLFQQALLRHLSGDPKALDTLKDGVDKTLPKLLIP
ncbi:TetR/AcrR family transcriptional regulator [Kribbella sp. NPDC051620]|uniref:TetR/AcrR family transcriptional regulator n=1 Tax=Kribbella sp. NPDC051620 TaxID=3364120 RepID=UPI0037895F10